MKNIDYISLGICVSSAFLIVGIGIAQIYRKKPVGFWSFQPPPSPRQVADVRAYNRKHGKMWIWFGLGMPAAYGLGAIAPYGFAAWLIIGSQLIGGLAAMIAYHNHLTKKYVKK